MAAAHHWSATKLEVPVDAVAGWPVVSFTPVLFSAANRPNPPVDVAELAHWTAFADVVGPAPSNIWPPVVLLAMVMPHVALETTVRVTLDVGAVAVPFR